MLNIAIDIQPVAEKRTGVGQFTYRLVQAVTQADPANRYTLFLFDFRRKFRDRSLERKNVSVKKVRLPGRVVTGLWDAAACPPVESLVGSFDLFHFTNYRVPPMRENRALTTIYDMTFVRYPQYTSPGALKGPLRRIRDSVHRTRGVITVSEFSKSEIVHLLDLPEERIHVVYPGVSPVFRAVPDAKARPHVLERSGIQAPYILSVGTLEPRKNLPALLRAYARNRSYFRRRRCKLLLVGMKGWLYEDVFRTVRSHALEEDVRFSGYVEDHELPAIYRGAAFAVFPSFYEGFGMPLLEAMASSTPVLASNIDAHREVLQDAALFFEPGDEDGLAQRMKELCENEGLRRSLAEKGGQRARHFTWEASAAALVSIYRSAAQGTAWASGPRLS